MWIFSSEHLWNSLNRRSYANTKNKYIWAKYHVAFPCLQIKGRRREPYFNELNVDFIGVILSQPYPETMNNSK